MAVNVKKNLKKARQRTYLAKDFDSFRSELLSYARTYFGDKIQDFSEASVGGLLLDMAAMVGDSMTFYLDHQFNELNWATAVESQNIQRHIQNAGVKIHGAAPAVCEVSFFIEVSSEISGLDYRPKYASLPMIQQGTVVSGGGVKFTLVEGVNFAEVDNAGNLTSIVVVSSTNADGSPASYILEKVYIVIKFACLDYVIIKQKVSNSGKNLRI